MPARKYYPGYEHNGRNGLLIYLEKIPDIPKHKAKWKCFCGVIFETSVSSLIENKTTSCGCWNRLMIDKKLMDPNIFYLYNLFNNIKQRCYNKNHSSYKRYGGRGIVVSSEWQNDRTKFVEDILNNLGHRPTDKHQLDRINNNGDYEIKNLRWSSPKENSNNKSDNHFIRIGEETKTLSGWAKISNISSSLILERIKNNCPEDKLLLPTKIYSKEFKNTDFKSLHRGINTRCFNGNNRHFKWYGARGITFYEPWKISYKQFQQDILSSIGVRPSSKHQLDRINNDGNYEPNNIRWATPKENSNNKSTNKLIEINGEIKTLSEWANYSNISKGTIRKRILLGHTGQDLLKPVFKRRFNNDEIKNIKNISKKLSMWELAKQFGCGHTTILDILHNRGSYKTTSKPK